MTETEMREWYTKIGKVIGLPKDFNRFKHRILADGTVVEIDFTNEAYKKYAAGRKEIREGKRNQKKIEMIAKAEIKAHKAAARQAEDQAKLEKINARLEEQKAKLEARLKWQ